MGEASNAVSLLPALGYLGPDLLDDASEIAAYGGARSSEESDVLPIGGVESNTLDLGEDVSVTQFG